jgi:hypothetical protein
MALVSAATLVTVNTGAVHARPPDPVEEDISTTTGLHPLTVAGTDNETAGAAAADGAATRTASLGITASCHVAQVLGNTVDLHSALTPFPGMSNATSEDTDNCAPVDAGYTLIVLASTQEHLAVLLPTNTSTDEHAKLLPSPPLFVATSNDTDT